MRVQLLGTGAKEGIPSTFCACDTCKLAMQLGGKEIRARSGAIVEDNILVDLSCDVFFHKVRFGLDLSKVEHIFYTHSHTDHFSTQALDDILMPVNCVRRHKTVHIYGNKQVHQCFVSAGFGNSDQLCFHTLQHGDVVKLGDKTVTAIGTTHDVEEKCLLYLFEGDGSVFFGNDSAFYPDEVYQLLEGKQLSIAILDCCHALSLPRKRHMNLEQCVAVKHRLQQQGSVTSNTQVVITHFTHNASSLHRDIESAASAHGIITAYDGIVLKT